MGIDEDTAMIPLRRLALALLLSLALVAGASALDGYAHSQTVEYAACDQAVYQQDVVILKILSSWH